MFTNIDTKETSGVWASSNTEDGPPLPAGKRLPKLVPNTPYAEMERHGCFDQSGCFMAADNARSEHIVRYGFTVVTLETGVALATLLRGHKCLEVGAGTGWVSHVLAQQGVDIVASDMYLGSANFHAFQKLWRNDHSGNSLDLLPGDFGAVVMCWPYCQSSFGFDVIERMVSGQVLVYEGEGAHGCTGPDEMHAALNDPAQWRTDLAATQSLNRHHLRFRSLRDYWHVYTKV